MRYCFASTSVAVTKRKTLASIVELGKNQNFVLYWVGITSNGMFRSGGLPSS